MEEFALNSQEIQSLRLAHRNAVKKRHADRIKAVLLLGTGWSLADVSKVLLLDPDTLRRYVTHYRKGGVDKLLKMDYQGSLPNLDASQQTKLDAHLESKTYPCVAGIVVYVENTFGIKYSVNGLTDLLHRMDYTYKKPKIVPGKANGEAQKEFVEKYKKLRENKGKHDPIYFMDAVHPQHNTVAGYGWIKRGKEKWIKSNTGRKRVNINGVINIETMKTVTRVDDSINAQSTIDLFKQIEKKHRKAKVIYIVCDNARYYYSKLVRAFAAMSRIKLIFLPPYSPNLNLIERLWKYFRKKVTHLKYYESYEDFKQACLAFFETIPKHKKALQTLLAENFPILDASLA